MSRGLIVMGPDCGTAYLCQRGSLSILRVDTPLMKASCTTPISADSDRLPGASGGRKKDPDSGPEGVLHHVQQRSALKRTGSRRHLESICPLR